MNEVQIFVKGSKRLIYICGKNPLKLSFFVTQFCGTCQQKAYIYSESGTYQEPGPGKYTRIIYGRKMLP